MLHFIDVALATHYITEIKRAEQLSAALYTAGQKRQTWRHMGVYFQHEDKVTSITE